jgi:CRP-like cAMP-binding protein
MFTQFINYIRGIETFDQKDLDTIEAEVDSKKIRKRAFFLQEGQVCNEVAWVAKGCMRMYLVDKGAKEHIIDFAPESNYIADTTSFIHRTPSLFFINAIEDSELLLFSMETIKKLIVEIPQFEKVIHTATLHQIAKYQDRIATTLTLSADEKYRLLLLQNPHLPQQVPQHMIASYLGITPETLSRIRNKYES